MQYLFFTKRRETITLKRSVIFAEFKIYTHESIFLSKLFLKLDVMKLNWPCSEDNINIHRSNTANLCLPELSYLNAVRNRSRVFEEPAYHELGLHNSARILTARIHSSVTMYHKGIAAICSQSVLL